jgi:hypothetical protein
MRALFTLMIAALSIVGAATIYSGELSGAYASKLSAADVIQIKAAVSKDRHVSHNVKKIEALKADKVAVQTTSRTAVDQDTTYDFNVYKRAGVWTIDENSVQISTESRDFRTNGPSIIR